jgi:hypothetical protein
LFSHYPKDLRVVGDDFLRSGDFWTLKRVKTKGLDGRSAIALMNATQWWGTSIVLRRKIETSPQMWTLEASFSDLEFCRSQKRLELMTLPELASVTALILAVDAERMLRRAAELPVTPAVQINLVSDVENGDLQSHLIGPAYDLLKSRAIRVKPQDWQGPQVQTTLRLT